MLGIGAGNFGTRVRVILASGVAALLALVLLLPALSDVVSLLRRPARRQPASCEARPRLLFLVPAHNEELLIQSCVQSLCGIRYPRERFAVVVIADNCYDGTAALARAAGAHCLERNDPAARGKPRAIAWALQHVPLPAYDAVVIVDADTVVDEAFGTVLAAAAPLEDVAGQAFFDVANPTETAVTRMAAVLATAIHRFAYPLKQRAGLNVPLVGNGMCIGRNVLLRHGWRAFSICEDWELYAQLTALGVPIRPLTDARLYAQEARSLRQSTSQRQRWTAGKLTVLARYAAPLLSSRLITARQKLDALAELVAPGPAVHLGLAILLSGAMALLHAPYQSVILLALGAGLARPAVYAAAAMTKDPNPVQALCAFLFMPVYVGWRLVTVVRALGMVGDKPWIRTPRHQQPSALHRRPERPQTRRG